MQHFTGVAPDMAAMGRVIREEHRRAQSQRLAKLRPLPERVAEAMQEIAAARGSCDMEDLTLRFPGETITESIVASARRLAGRRSTARVA